MTKTRKSLFCLVAATFLFITAFGGMGAVMTAKADAVPSMDVVDTYLRENGYSEDFIEGMGEQTKRHLYNEQASYCFSSVLAPDYAPASTRSTPPDDGAFDNFNHEITVSTIDDDPTDIQYIVTYNFTWNSDVAANDYDLVALAWNSEFTFIAPSAVYEVYGPGERYERDNQLIVVPVPESFPNKTFIYLTGSDAIFRGNQQAGVANRLNLSQSQSYTLYYQSNAWGKYKVNRKNFCVAYSITIAEPTINKKYNNVCGTVFHWLEDYEVTDFQITFELPLRLSFTSTIEDTSRYIQSGECYETIIR